MKKLLALLLLLGALTGPARSASYFRFEPGRDVQGLVALPLFGGLPGGVLYGSKTSVLKHHSEDGYWLIPGVDWSLLDAGLAKPDTEGSFTAILGPSLDTSEPLKAMLLAGLNGLTAPDTLASVKHFLRPAQAGDKSVTANLGVGLAVDPGDFTETRQIRGSVTANFGVQIRF